MANVKGKTCQSTRNLGFRSSILYIPFSLPVDSEVLMLAFWEATDKTLVVGAGACKTLVNEENARTCENILKSVIIF